MTVDVPLTLSTHIVPKWRVVGTVALEVAGTKFNYYSHGDDGIVDAIYYHSDNYSERPELSLFIAFARQAEFVLDVGANTGIYSIVARAVNPEAAIYAFEPYDVNADRLEKNLELNDAQVSVVRSVVGAVSGPVAFTVPSDEIICDVVSVESDFTRQFYPGQVSYREIERSQITLDEFAVDQELDGVGLIKIDVESYEMEVLKGARKMLANSCPVIFCELFVDDDRSKFYREVLKPLGYHCYAILATGIVRLDELLPNPDCRNFVFSTIESRSRYLSFQQLDQLVAELHHSPPSPECGPSQPQRL